MILQATLYSRESIVYWIDKSRVRLQPDGLRVDPSAELLQLKAESLADLLAIKQGIHGCSAWMKMMIMMITTEFY